MTESSEPAPAEQEAVAQLPIDGNMKAGESKTTSTTFENTAGEAVASTDSKSPISPAHTTTTPATPTTAPTLSSPTTTTNNDDVRDSTAASSAIAAAKDKDINPPDFAGEVQTNNDLPSQETLRRLEDHTVLDTDGKSIPFKNLYTGHNVARRVLIIFVRHFFCGNCQEYLRTLASSITPDALLRLPVSTFIAVVGCGAPELISHYVSETACPFPVYADPTRRLYTELGMVRTLALGERPAYMQNKSIGHTIVSGVVQGLKQVKSGLVLKMGDQRQVGGEFLFEPTSIETPISTPNTEPKKMDFDDKANSHQAEKTEEKKVTWCHRMRTTRDHAEMPELMEVLGLDGNGQPIEDQKRWEKALRIRKGTGLSLASQMSRMSLDAKALADNGVKA